MSPSMGSKSERTRARSGFIFSGISVLGVECFKIWVPFWEADGDCPIVVRGELSQSMFTLH